MAEAYTAHDRIAIYLSGGDGNHAPSASLGGAISVRPVKGMTARYDVPVAGVIVEDATPENTEGEASIAIDGDAVVYTPPDGDPGDPVTILAGERKIVYGADPTKAIRLYRPTGYTFEGTAEFHLVDTMNGVLGMSDVEHAERVAGAIHYRAFFVKALADAGVVKLWVDTDGQATYSVALEVPTADTIQTIADQETAPAGVSWEDAASEGTALVLGTMTEGQTYGVWLRRTFPAAGTVASKESVNLHLQHQGV